MTASFVVLSGSARFDPSRARRRYRRTGADYPLTVPTLPLLLRFDETRLNDKYVCESMQKKLLESSNTIA
jgi:hypothetical protein